jgi:hypothetical protein
MALTKIMFEDVVKRTQGTETERGEDDRCDGEMVGSMVKAMILALVGILPKNGVEAT